MKKLCVAFLVDTLEPYFYTNKLIELLDNNNYFSTKQWHEINIGNSVIFDPQKGMYTELLLHREILCRVSQVNSEACYAMGFNFNKVIEIPKERYLEKKVSCIYHELKDGIALIHHINSTSTIAVIDFVKRRLKSGH